MLIPKTRNRLLFVNLLFKVLKFLLCLVCLYASFRMTFFAFYLNLHQVTWPQLPLNAGCVLSLKECDFLSQLRGRTRFMVYLRYNVVVLISKPTT